jgi:uncharacterized lipoprotein YbaY
MGGGGRRHELRAMIIKNDSMVFLFDTNYELTT